ncbi:MAG TPA: hypothetical protein VIE43_19120 [Thermoanaerobaculia bacterium]|jgi:hypothetical protein|nr:hypothetical protein [Thermoanaerobaculia bacterium]
MTLAFLSLFFGLISGPYPVELTLDGPASAVEVLVDGRSAARLAEPPWKGTIDLGRDLLPHEIVARVLDAQGREIGRAQEWANLPHPLAKVEIALEGGGGSPSKAAKVLWTNLSGEAPRSVSLAFDGLPVKLDSHSRGELPPHDLNSIHVLTAQVDFQPDKSVRRDLAFGGEYGTEVSTELTGVPVHARSGEVPPAGKLAGWLTSEGKPLAVDAVEEGPGKLYVVCAPSTIEIDRKMGKSGHMIKDIRYEMRLGRQDQIRFVPSFPERIMSSGGFSDLFEISPSNDYSTGGLLWLMLRNGPREPPQKLRIADAVATAGLAAVTEDRRRAVLLVLSGHEQDASQYDPASVRHYLATLRVPLFVWSLGAPEPASTASAWGATDVSGTQHLYDAARQVRDELDSQRIVMVDGRHLPQSIALSPAAAGLQLAGAGTP